MEKEQLLEFTINLSLEISKLERRVKDLEAQCSSCGQPDERIELCLNNQGTLVNALNILSSQIATLKPETKEVTDGTIERKGEEGDEVHEENLRSEEG